jgi:hypothetical protein
VRVESGYGGPDGGKDGGGAEGQDQGEPAEAGRVRGAGRGPDPDTGGVGGEGDGDEEPGCGEEALARVEQECGARRRRGAGGRPDECGGRPAEREAGRQGRKRP